MEFKRRAISVSTTLLFMGVITVTVAEREQIRIRWLIWRFGKDRSWVSGHLHVDRSSEELDKIGPAAIPYLDDAFDTEQRPEIRRLIVLTLWGIGDDDAGPTLLKALSDPAAIVQEEATLVAGKLRIAEALPRLRALVHDTDDGIRETAFYALGEVGTPEDLPLVEAGMHDENRRVREQAHEAFRNISNRDSGAESP